MSVLSLGNSAMRHNCHTTVNLPPVTEATSLTRRERRTAETRRAIMRAARELFDERGYDETTIDDIAERADVAQRTFFRYFPTKEAVLFGVSDDIRRVVLAELAERPAGEPPMRSLLLAIRRALPLVEERRAELDWAFRLMSEHLDSMREPAALKAQFQAELAAVLGQRTGWDLGEDPRPLAWSGLVMSCVGATMRAMCRGDRPVEEAFRELLDETSAALAGALADWSDEAAAPAGR